MAPSPADRRVALAPFGLEIVERGGRRLGGFGPVDRFQIGHDQLRSCQETNASKLPIRWVMQVCTVVSGKTVAIAAGKP